MEVKGTVILTVFLPILIAVIMFGLGLTVRREDFARVLKMPKTVLVALGIKLLILPLVAVGLSYIFQLSPQFSVGMILVAAAPSSVMANVFSKMANADVALSLCLTAIDNILTSVTLPMFVMLAFYMYMGQTQQIGLQFSESAKIFALILFPVLAGMAFTVKFPKESVSVDKVLRIISLVVLVILIVLVVAANRELFLTHYQALTIVVMLFDVLCFVLGYFLSRLMGISIYESRSNSMAMGIQGTALVVTVALTFLKDPAFAMPAAFFSLSMYLLAFGWVPILARLK